MEEDPRFLSEQLITYIGNKRTLLPMIGKGVAKVCRRLSKKQLRIFDAFSGSGVVSRYLKQFSSILYSNDLETYCRILNTCYLTNRSLPLLQQLPARHQQLLTDIEQRMEGGIIAELYAPRNDQDIHPEERVFYTHRNAVFLDTARRCIGELETEMQPYFLAPLLTEASIHTNTSGVFKGFHKNQNGIGQFGGRAQNALQRILAPITLPLPVFSRFESECHILQQDATAAAHSIPDIDLAYLDPPYNQHPYGSNYFMLNVIAEYKKPENLSRVSGIPTNWNRSAYNKRAQAEESLDALIRATKATHILVSYNSEGFITPQQMTSMLRRHGKVTEMKQEYATFRGCRNLAKRSPHVAEFLYLLERA